MFFPERPTSQCLACGLHPGRGLAVFVPRSAMPRSRLAPEHRFFGSLGVGAPGYGSHAGEALCWLLRSSLCLDAWKHSEALCGCHAFQVTFCVLDAP